MPQLIVLPHQELCPEGTVIDAKAGVSICDNLLENDIEIEHAGSTNKFIGNGEYRIKKLK